MKKQKNTKPKPKRSFWELTAMDTMHLNDDLLDRLSRTNQISSAAVALLIAGIDDYRYITFE